MDELTGDLQALWAMQRAIKGLAEEATDPDAWETAQADIARVLAAEEPGCATHGD